MNEQSLQEILALLGSYQDVTEHIPEAIQAILQLHREDVIKELKEARFSDDILDSEIKRLSDIQDYITKRIAQLR